MEFLNVFSKRLRFLRTSRYLSLTDIAVILDLNSKSSKTTVSRWEQAKNWPSTEMLIRLSRLFAYPVDWFIGNNDDAYVTSYILRLERAFYTNGDASILSYGEYYNIFAPPEIYRDEEQRLKHYSLQVRTDILFYLNLLVHIYRNTGNQTFLKSINASIYSEESIKTLLHVYFYTPLKANTFPDLNSLQYRHMLNSQ